MTPTIAALPAPTKEQLAEIFAVLPEASTDPERSYAFAAMEAHRLAGMDAVWAASR